MPKPELRLVGHPEHQPAIRLEGFQAWFGETCVVHEATLDFPKNKITCLVGPSGSGKSTLIIQRHYKSQIKSRNGLSTPLRLSLLHQRQCSFWGSRQILEQNR